MRRLLPILSDSEAALFRSQGGPLASAPFVSTPWDRTCRLEPQPLRVLLLRRLRLPLPSQRVPVDVVVLSTSLATIGRRGLLGRLGRRGFLLENAAAKVCREAGRRVRTNAFLRDMDLGPINPLDARRLEVVVDGLPLFSGAQFAVDTTLVCPLTRDGAAKPP